MVVVVVPQDPLQHQPPDGGAGKYHGLLLSSQHRRGGDGGVGLESVGSSSKVNQLDAHVLDEELLDLLRLQLAQATSLFSPGFMERWKPELSALLDFLLFRFTILRGATPTPGMAMRGLTYATTNHNTHTGGGVGVVVGPPRASQRLLLALLYIAGRWGFARLRRCMTVWGWGTTTTITTDPSSPRPSSSPGVGGGGRWRRAMAYKAVEGAETIFRIAWLLNLLVFLRHGRYPSLLERIAGMRLVNDHHSRVTSSSSSSQGVGGINFHFMNRQLLWDHFSSLALVAMPMVNWDKLRRRVSGLLNRERPRAMDDDGDGGGGVGGCALCGSEEAQTPYVTDCGHVFCYYCLKTAVMEESEGGGGGQGGGGNHFACPR